MPYTGSCACGSVKYEFDSEPHVTVACHCAICRKATGSPFAAWSLVPKEQFRWTSGTDDIQEFRSSSHGRRLFCKRCGSKLGNLSDLRPMFMHVGTGTLDDAPVMRIAFHAYTASKAKWFAITDELPQFDELPSTT